MKKKQSGDGSTCAHLLPFLKAWSDADADMRYHVEFTREGDDDEEDDGEDGEDDGEDGEDDGEDEDEPNLHVKQVFVAYGWARRLFSTGVGDDDDDYREPPHASSPPPPPTSTETKRDTTGLLPIVTIDATWTRHLGVIAIMNGTTGTYNTIPMAVGIMQGENNDTWATFIHDCAVAFPFMRTAVIISDGSSSIAAGIRTEERLDSSTHRLCWQHRKRAALRWLRRHNDGFGDFRGTSDYHGVCFIP